MRGASKGAARGRATLRALTRLWFCGVPLHIGCYFGGGEWMARESANFFFLRPSSRRRQTSDEAFSRPAGRHVAASTSTIIML